MTDVLNPFTDQQKDEIIEQIKSADNLIDGIQKATGAGIELDDRLATVKANRAKLVRIKQTYFPNG